MEKRIEKKNNKCINMETEARKYTGDPLTRIYTHLFLLPIEIFPIDKFNEQLIHLWRRSRKLLNFLLEYCTNNCLIFSNKKQEF